MKHDVLISIITPSYNSEQFIAETIASVQAQTYNNWEMIIVDDASSDTTQQIIEKHAQQDSRIKYHFLTENSGAAVARNKATELAKGAFVAFLDADDLWMPQKLEKQLVFMNQHSAAVCFSSYDMIDEQGETLYKRVVALKELSYDKQLVSNYVGNLTGIYNVEKLGKLFSPNIRKRQDWALWLKSIEKAGMAYGIKEPLAYYRVRTGSMSSNKLNLLKHNYIFYRKALNFGVFKSCLYLIRFLIEHFLVKSKQITTTQHT